MLELADGGYSSATTPAWRCIVAHDGGVWWPSSGLLGVGGGVSCTPPKILPIILATWNETW